ncbi:hypothetical protein EMCG_09130 [[Emmonsia] crescens]|uniref:Hpc2-related domain-containing protein n=1 Tax=[Emmonsia] crescens TaxID=73230 RepID=A0A0G2I2W2_9EURO|nr:hypothetical protein EMCG_09130 [Emmonsia crescens UAMH 3008]
MSGDVADEGWRGRGRTRRGEQPKPQPQPQPQPQLQEQQQQQQLEQHLQQQLPTTKTLKSSSLDLSSPNLSECESVPTPAHFLSRASSPNPVAAQDTSASTSTPAPPVTASKNTGDAEVKREKQGAVAVVTGTTTTTTKVKRTRRKKEDKEPKEPKEKNKETKPRRRRTSNGKNNNNGNNNNNPSQAQNQQLSITNDNADRGASRKRPKLDHSQEPTRQSKITDLVTPQLAPAPAPVSTLSPTHATSSTQFHLAPSSTSTSPRLQPHHQPHHAHSMSQNSNYDAFPANGSSRPPFRPYHIQPAPSSAPALAPVSAPVSSPALALAQPQPPPQRSSGQNYDPIRSAFDNSSVTAPQFSASSKISLPSSRHQFSPPPNTRTPPPRPVYRASASPAISSIIDPPVQPSASAPPQSSLFHQQNQPSPENTHSVKHSPASATPTSTTNTNTTTIQQPKAVHQPLLSSSLLQEPITMDIDSGNSAPAPAPSVPSKPTPTASTKKGTGASTGPPSTAPSPKPPRAKDTARPPRPSGSGLLAGTLFGVDPTNTSNSTSKSTPDIIVHIPLNGKTNQIINFTRLAEEQYGFDALHPRLAAQRERLARVNAASAALERNEKNAKGAGGTDSAAEDDLSLDADRDSDGDGDVLMSGMGGSASAFNNGHAGSDAGVGAAAAKKKRRRKIEEYDRDDPFVDDSELAWQEHAAASKDGFFVYSGPLIPEGEKVAVERYIPLLTTATL